MQTSTTVAFFRTDLLVLIWILRQREIPQSYKNVRFFNLVQCVLSGGHIERAATTSGKSLIKRSVKKVPHKVTVK